MRFQAEVLGADAERAMLRRVAAVTGRELESVLRQQARALAIELARLTGPQSYEKAVEKTAVDVARVFPSVERGADHIYSELVRRGEKKLASWFWYEVKNRARVGNLERIMRAGKIPRGVKPQEYEALRGPYGRPPKDVAMVARATPGAQQRFMRRKERRIGRVKAGWYVAGLALGGRLRVRNSAGRLVQALPKWVRRHARDRSLGGAEVFVTEQLVEAVLENRVEYAQEAISETQWQTAHRRAELRFQRSVLRAVDEIGRRRGRAGGRV